MTAEKKDQLKELTEGGLKWAAHALIGICAWLIVGIKTDVEELAAQQQEIKIAIQLVTWHDTRIDDLETRLRNLERSP